MVRIDPALLTPPQRLAPMPDGEATGADWLRWGLDAVDVYGQTRRRLEALQGVVGE